MNPWLLAKAVAVWGVILVLAFANAGLREVILIPRFGNVRSLTASGVILSLLVLFVAYVSVPWLGAMRTRELLAVGLGWFALTLAFDLLLGMAQGEPLRQQLDAYLFKRGNLWPVVLLVTACAPYLAAKLRGWI
ncbi:MAG: hypothetical protein OJF61_000395 [Rhodanobacteraceae bacterium]|nr:MAG: hypothetical protein OJF61_000395 [Rhodanobacteraceae bacterium]